MKNELVNNNSNENELQTANNLTKSSFMLTTIDNPFNPFVDFDSWFLFDVEKGYYSCSLLARITNNANDLTELEERKDIERAIDEIIKYDPTNMYTKIGRDGLKPINLS